MNSGIVSRIKCIENEKALIKSDNSYYYSGEIDIKEIDGKVIKSMPIFGRILKFFESKIITVIIIYLLFFMFSYYKDLERKQRRRLKKHIDQSNKKESN